MYDKVIDFLFEIMFFLSFHINQNLSWEKENYNQDKKVKVFSSENSRICDHLSERDIIF